MSESMDTLQMGDSSSAQKGDFTTSTADDLLAGDKVAKADPTPLIIKWLGKEIPIVDVADFKTVGDLKEHIHEKTGVQVARQKLLNLQFKGKPAADSTPIADLKLKPGFKIMMMGSLEKDIEKVDIPPEDRPEIVNDLDFNTSDKITLVESNDVYLGKISKRVQEYEAKQLNPLRPDKKLLVLDIDYTLFDHRSPAETGAELMRPGLHEFLRDAYRDYDIAIWSATSMKWIEEKMKLLHVSTHPDYKIAFYMDYLAMITVHTERYGIVEVKPLGVIWGKYPQFSSKNTIMLDDLRRNFLMNPQSGLRIRPFRQAHLNRDKDRELSLIGTYLQRIARLDDFTTLDHQNWESYERKERRHGHGSRKRRPRDE